MPTELLYPDADSSEGTGITKNGAATSYECLDDPRGSYDDATTYIQLFHTASTFNLDEHGEPTVEMDTVDWVNHEQRMLKESAGAQDVTASLYIAAAAYVDLAGSATSWTTYTSSNTLLNPATSTPWAILDLYGTDIMLRQATGGASGGLFSWCSGHNMQYSYQLPRGGYHYLLNTWLPPILAAGVGGAVQLKELMNFYLPRHKFKVAPGGKAWRADFAAIAGALRVRPVYII